MKTAMTRRGQARMVLAMLGVMWTALPCATASAQRDRDGDPERARRLGGVPREVALEVTAVWNDPATRRVRGDFALAPTDTVRGDLAVLGGRARLAGVVTGQVVVLNGDAALVDGARIERSLTVIGGAFDSPERPNVGGEIRVWSAAYRYHEVGDTLVADLDFFSRWSSWMRDDERSSGRTRSDLLVTTAHTYNRVEGLPIYVGPRVRARSGDTRVRAEVFGIFRTGDALTWKRENLGHRVLFEVRQGNSAGVAIGGRLFDEVDAVEKWQLTDSEVGLNAFLFTRDYRDYWQRHGGQGYVSLFAGRGSELKASYGEERWSSRRARNVLSIVNDKVPWRVNPLAEDGVMKLLTVSATFDTRNSPKDPRAGWYLRGEYEHGDGTLARVNTLLPTAPAPASDAAYSRALLDLRRYNRLGPNGSLNMRAVLGGWIDGDPLPAQRRFSVSGIDALPGFDFRRQLSDTDVGTCATGDEQAYAALGRPALCDRMALLQIEWKGDFRVNLFGDDDDLGDRRWVFGRVKADGAWVVFANSGRGWLVGPRDSDNLFYPKGGVPDIKSWRTDLGGGFDFGNFGVYVAQAVSESGLSPNVYMRLSRRF